MMKGYGSIPSARLIQFDQQPPVAPVQQFETEADKLCRGQAPETVIPLEGNRKFVVCVMDGKGWEQWCPKGLFYHEQTRRCERKLGPLDNYCVSQPCLNGGECVSTDSSYQCKCAPGYDGKNCELDARICQTQQPCGQEGRCQSFRLGAGLQYICIFQDGLAYGLSSAQIQPSPCKDVDGTYALLVSNKGFIMCDGERMFIESCPGGTIWDDVNKACVWPDLQGVVGVPQPTVSLQKDVSEIRTMTSLPGYGGSQLTINRQIDQPKFISTLDTQRFPRPTLDLNILSKQQQFGGYGVPETRQELIRVQSPAKQLLRVEELGFGDRVQQPSQDLLRVQDSGYGGRIQNEQKTMIWPQPTKTLLEVTPQSSGY